MCSSDLVFVLFFLSSRKRNPNQVAAPSENPMASQLTLLPTPPCFWNSKVGLAELPSMWGKTPRLYSSWDIAGSVCCLYGEDQCLSLSTDVEWRARELSCGVGLIHFWIVPAQTVHFCCQRVFNGLFLVSSVGSFTANWRSAVSCSPLSSLCWGEASSHLQPSLLFQQLLPWTLG